MRAQRLRRLDDFVIRRVGPAKFDVLQDRARKQKIVLGHYADLLG